MPELKQHRSMEEITQEYKDLAQQLGNVTFEFEALKQQYLVKLSQLSREVHELEQQYKQEPKNEPATSPPDAA